MPALRKVSDMPVALHLGKVFNWVNGFKIEIKKCSLLL